MWSTSPLYLLYLTTGFTIGFGHCIGMCGPIVVALNFKIQSRRKIFAQLLYHYGRITTYAVLGGLMGATGTFTTVATRLEGIQKIAMIASGVLIVVMGLGTFGLGRWGQAVATRFDTSKFISKGFQSLGGIQSTWVYYPVGLLFGLLPCGPVYTALIGAARSGMEAENIARGILSGMGLMAAFGLGTVPALFLVTKIADWGISRYKGVIYKLGSLLMIGLGIYFIVKAIVY